MIANCDKASVDLWFLDKMNDLRRVLRGLNVLIVVTFVVLVWDINFSGGLALPQKQTTESYTEIPVDIENNEDANSSDKFAALALADDDAKQVEMATTGRGLISPSLQGLNEEDRKVRRDWGGNCTARDWELCSNVKTFGQDKYDDLKGILVGQRKNCSDPNEFPPLCLVNEWTVTRCHLFCMSIRCNKDLKAHYDQYVQHDGYC